MSPIRKALFIFLGLAVLTTVAQAAATSSDKRFDKSERGLTDWFTGLVNRIENAITSTIQEETASIGKALSSVKDAFKQSLTATKDAAMAGLNLYATIPRIAWNIIASDEHNDYGAVIRAAIEESRASVSKAFDSMKSAFTTSWGATKSVAKASFDVSFVFPKLGLNFVNQKNISKSLADTYEHEKESIRTALSSVQVAGESLATVGQNVVAAAWELSSLLPKMAVEFLGTDPDRLDETLYMRLKEAEETALRALDSVAQAGSLVAEAGYNVAKAGFDLATLIPKYGLELLTEDDRQNFANQLETHINQTSESVEKAVTSVRQANAKMMEATNSASEAGSQLRTALPEISYGLLLQNEKGDAIRRIFKETMETLNNALLQVREAGKNVTDAGQNIAKASSVIGVVLPKFGLGLLDKEENLIKNATISKIIREQKDSVTNVVHQINEVGSQIVQAGNNFVSTTNGVGHDILEHGVKVLEDANVDIHLISDTSEAIEQSAIKAKDKLSNGISKIGQLGNGILEQGKKAVEGAKEAAKDVVSSASKTIDEAKNKIDERFGSWTDNLLSKGKDILQHGDQVVDRVKDSAADASKAFENAIGKTKNKVNDIASGFGQQLSSIFGKKQVR